MNHIYAHGGIGNMICFHNYKPFENHIFCTRCGKIIVKQCDHKWVRFDTIEITDWFPSYDGKRKARTYVLQCSECGDMKNHNVYY